MVFWRQIRGFEDVRQETQEQGRQEEMSLYENIHKKRKRIAAGSGERMRRVGSKGAPTAAAFKKAAKTAKNKTKPKTRRA
jgi:hypothetical protein